VISKIAVANTFFKNTCQAPPRTDGAVSETKETKKEILGDLFEKRKVIANCPANRRAFYINIFQDNLNAAREAAEAQAEHFRKMRIAFEIAARIMRGDNVPQKDKDFLMKHSPGLFKLAMTARPTDNDDAKDHKEALSDEANGGSSQVTAETMQIISSTQVASISI